ncbi:MULTISPECIES: FUSC family protein [unclassified Rhizobium]|jgi:uncharacterized membrane protein YccC|uniref:FUSC family protein n=1 Tax=unclassified Rhizobium TaxID=2613769 RepID=UPI000646B14E|nr:MULTISPECIES: FUSC family protein [unclassified Rhizobium]OJY74125.1 MAG: hypothetical protein BGP09_27415 [Rhizobium sp. 60-20]RKD61442.1 putative membrane protein YccC [Rhizobium sp. WW_1]
MIARPSPRALLFAISGYLAVILALYVALALDLPNPWWAMATVFIVQPTRPLVGAIWAKAFYRAAGTIVGAIVAVILVPNLVNSPELMILAIAVWIALCVFFGLLDRSPRSYLFMLPGYTAALVGLSTATHPEAIFDIAVARSEEIIIGVLAPAVVQSILFPRSVSVAIFERLDGIIADARIWIAEGLRTLTPVPAPSQVAGRLTEMNLMAADWRFEGTFSLIRRRALWALEERLIVLLPQVTAVEDTLEAMRHSESYTDELAAAARQVADWVATAGAEKDKASAAAENNIAASIPTLNPRSGWEDMLVVSLADRLTELMGTWKECLVLATAVKASVLQPDSDITRLLGSARPRGLHTDKGIALLSAAVAGLTVIGIAAFATAIQWEGSPFTITVAAMCCSLFAVADDPTPPVRAFLTGAVLILPVTLFYQFAILPAIDGFVMLAVVLFPVVGMLGLLSTYPKIMVSALGAIVAFSAMLALGSTYVSDMPGVLNNYFSFLLGPVFALVGLGLARVVPTQRAVRRILRAGWRELAALTKTRSVPSANLWAGRMLDRVGLLLPRLSAIQTGEEPELREVLRGLRLGTGIVELRRLHDLVSAGAEREIDTVLTELAAHFDALAAGQTALVPSDIVDHLDAAIRGMLQLPDAGDRHAGVSAAMRLRLTLSPHASAYRQEGATA